MTNLSGESCVESSPELGRLLDLSKRKKKKPLPRLIPPANVKRAYDFARLARAGISLKVSNFHHVGKIEAYPRGIFGGGLLVSDADAARFDEANKKAEERAQSLLNSPRPTITSGVTIDLTDASPLGGLSASERAIVEELNRKAKA